MVGHAYKPSTGKAETGSHSPEVGLELTPYLRLQHPPLKHSGDRVRKTWRVDIQLEPHTQTLSKQQAEGNTSRAPEGGGQAQTPLRSSPELRVLRTFLYYCSI